MEETHRIRRLSCRVCTGDARAALASRSRVRDSLYPDWLAELERGFREASKDAEEIHIPELRFELRVNALDDVAPALSQMARDRIRGLVPALQSQPPSVGLAAMLEYLQTGILPWRLRVAARTKTLAGLSVAAGDIALIASELPRALLPAYAFFTRWLPLLAQHRWVEIARNVDFGLAGIDVAKTLLDMTAPGTVAPSFHARVVSCSAVLAIAHAWRATPPESRSEFVQEGRNLLAAVSRESGFTVSERWLSRLPESPVTTHSRFAPPENTEPRRAQPARRHAREHSDDAPAAGSSPSSSAVQAVPVQEFSPTLADSTADAPLGLAVSDSGLILLHPFLTRLFAQTGVLGRDATTIAASQLSRAAALLHFAATGEDDARELDLGLARILLGVPIGAPLAVSPGLLLSSDREEVARLLISVIEHWNALGSSSVASLRTSFLQRGGVLEDLGASWKLHVEARPFDVLLSRLPWGLSIVKLPWMRAPVFVEWKTH